MIIYIKKFLQLSGWKVLTLDNTEDFEKIEVCPACNTTLAPIAVLKGQNAEIRVGVCPACGHTTYMDRPSLMWFSDFYEKKWDEKGLREPSKIKKLSDLTFTLAETLNLSKESRIFEIGSGFGSALKIFKDNGFSKLFGIEPSEHRAQASRGKGLSISTGDLENSEIQNQLKQKAPFKLIFSSHVFEHVRNPTETLHLSSTLQNPGDYFIMRVPNLIGEPIMQILFFLPHLHSFTELSMEMLFHKCGYQIINRAHTTKEEIVFIVQKGAGPKPPADPDALQKIRHKISSELNLKDGTSIFKWHRKNANDIRLIKYSLFQTLKESFEKNNDYRSILISKNSNNSNLPFEFQFKKEVLLTYK